MATTIQKAFRLPEDVVSVLNEQPNATQFVVEAVREKVWRDEIERFRESARRIAGNSQAERDVDFAFAAQSQAALAQ
jgi:hypothetical protein